MPGLGYFAFPPFDSAPTSVESLDGRLQQPHQPHNDVNAENSHTAESSRRTDPMAQEERESREERRRVEQELHAKRRRLLQDVQRQRRAEAQAELALQGEMEHVRIGLSIRDKYGRVDKARTGYVRAEMRRRDEQARLAAQWETYETRFKALVASDAPVAFTDIPWPVRQPPTTVLDLQAEAIVQFFLESLQTPGSTTTESDRLRSALLRWHPDKMSAVLSRTVASDIHSVNEGVNIVFRALHARIHHVKDHPASS